MELASRKQFRVPHGLGLNILVAVALATGADAETLVTQAIRLHEESGCEPGLRALRVLIA